MNEPIIVDDKTGVEFSVWQLGTGSAASVPVEGLESGLKVEVQAAGQKKMMDLAPVWGEPGSYQAVFYPTVETTYSYRFVGTVNDVPVDLTFTCSGAGHDMHGMEENTTRLAISDDVTRIEQRGSFSCPRPKAALGFPEPSVSIAELAASARTGMVAGVGGGILGFAGLMTAIVTRRKKPVSQG